MRIATGLIGGSELHAAILQDLGLAHDPGRLYLQLHSDVFALESDEVHDSCMYDLHE
jgi:hypothetical protein